MKTFGLVLIGLGAASIIGGGIPPYGFNQLPILLAEYKKAKAEKRTPTLDQQGAYYSSMAHRAGGLLVILGILIWFVGYLIGG
jgi:hypothetical protein